MYSNPCSNPAMEYIKEGEIDFQREIANKNIFGFGFVFPPT